MFKLTGVIDEPIKREKGSIYHRDLVVGYGKKYLTI
tara:strand:+ start:733 stop:840 length:108 start_codon:yes stop_codon:yes gene_type:complete